MTTNIVWGTVGGALVLAQNDLNGLANGSATPLQTEVNNSGGPQLATIWLHIDSQSNTYTVNSRVRVLFVPSSTPDAAAGTYPSFTSGASYKLADSNYLAADIYICPKAFSAAVADETMAFIQIPAGYWKPIIVNNSGFALPSTNNNKVVINTTPSAF